MARWTLASTVPSQSRKLIVFWAALKEMWPAGWRKWSFPLLCASEMSQRELHSGVESSVLRPQERCNLLKHVQLKAIKIIQGTIWRGTTGMKRSSLWGLLDMGKRVIGSSQLKGTFKVHVVQLPRNEQEHLQLHWAAQSLLQLGHESLQGQGIPHISEQPVPVHHHSHFKTFSLFIGSWTAWALKVTSNSKGSMALWLCRIYDS